MKPQIEICFEQLAYNPPSFKGTMRAWEEDCLFNDPEGTLDEKLRYSRQPPLLVLPNAGNVNRAAIVDYVKQYFEIWDITVTEVPYFFDQQKTTATGKILVKIFSIKVLEPFYISRDFNDIPSLFIGFKRWLCEWHKNQINVSSIAGYTSILKDNPLQIPADLGDDAPCIVLRSDGYGSPLSTINPSPDLVSAYKQFPAFQLASLIAHEVGHVLGLQHHGDLRNNARDGSNYYGLEYQHKDGWGPIMGRGRRSLEEIGQWSDGLYPSAYNWGGEQNDIKTMMVSWSLKKRPPYINYNIDTNFGIPQKLPRLARMITKEDIISAPNGDKSIEGMIGHPYDYDILKIVLEAGEYSFSIDSSIAANKVGVTLDPNMTNLYCECELNKEKSNIDISNSDAFQGEWPTNAVFKKIGFDRDETHIRFDGRLDGFKFKTSKFDLNLDKTTLVYIKVCGDWKDPVDGAKLATEVGKGYGQYGSMGRYYLKFEGKAPLGSKNDPIPNAHCEIFEYCTPNSNSNSKIALLVQDSKDESIQGSLQGIHVKELDIIIDGGKEKRKFLVYGEPKPSNYVPPATEKKFYITIPDPQTNECKRQEFIVGQIFPDKLI